ncbi:hypothetical protein PTSG_12755 [Salpingoeca rosetta]|uniref:Calcium load-activated calcium channel n=1 Tax=Salpingoeca rosetta (strain ATCC 50818 / BSB-021) TaxID=946362 RepID=F2UK25_SALR5|nr:uncharacterized protein PTSG_12755 [Salpingoeca rosetta]EGD77474.1 hypothetical protein PTSG_12755 [Salpingoeca rosetta]|eukprot:XP_004990362.1 hypothetical protein PTSG_12755 [Salpingoeca rosetta]
MDAAWVVLGIAASCAGIAEGINHVLIYRTSKFKSLKTSLDAAAEKVEKHKQEPDFHDGAFVDKKKQKKFEQDESQMKSLNQELTMLKFKSNLVIGLSFIVLMGVFNSIFEGVVVARLPFEPFSLLRNVTHRNLPGEDYTECAFIFLYITCTMAIRQNLQKALGVTPSRAAAKITPFGTTT